MQTNRVYPIGVALLILTVAAACDSNDDDDTAAVTTNDDDSTPLPNDDDDGSTDTTNDDDDTCESHLTETACPEAINPVGDLSCLGQNPDPEPGEGTVMVTGVVREFSTEAPVGGALLEVDGTPFTATSAPDGTFALEVPARQRVNIRASAPGYRVTWQYWMMTEASDFEADINLVYSPQCCISFPTAYWGKTPDTSACLVAGLVSDCQGEPVSGYGIKVRSITCAHPQSAVGWFKAGFPNGTQCPASEDGLWGAININLPEFTVQLLGADGEILQETGPLPCEPDATGLFNMQIH